MVFYFHIYSRPDFREHIGRSWRVLTTGDPRTSRKSAPRSPRSSEDRSNPRSSDERSKRGSKRGSKEGQRKSSGGSFGKPARQSRAVTRGSSTTKIGRIHTDFRKINAAGTPPVSTPEDPKEVVVYDKVVDDAKVMNDAEVMNGAYLYVEPHQKKKGAGGF